MNAGPPRRRWTSAAWGGVTLGGLALIAVAVGRSGTHSPLPVPSAAPSPVVPGTPTPERPFLFIEGDAPPPRMLAASADLSGTMLVFGGIAQTGHPTDLADTWTFDGFTWQEWNGPSPSPRHGAVLVPDARANSAVLVGGNAGTPEVWLWAEPGWYRMPDSLPAGAVPVSGADTGRQTVLVTRSADATAWHTWVLDDTQRLAAGTDPVTLARPPVTWREAPGPTPPVREMVSDSADGAALGLVASSEPGAAETWRWNGAWTRLTPSTPIRLEPLTLLSARDPAAGRPLLVEVDFLDQGALAGGTWVWTGRDWRRYDAVPDVVAAFNVTQPFAAAIAGRVEVVGGPRDSPSYIEVWSWDGTRWHHVAGRP